MSSQIVLLGMDRVGGVHPEERRTMDMTYGKMFFFGGM